VISPDPIQLNRSALSVLVGRRSYALRTASIPAAICLILAPTASHLTPGAGLLALFLSLLASVSAAVAIHRVMLLSPTDCESGPLFTFGVREARFFGASIGVGVLSVPGMILSAPLFFGLRQLAGDPTPSSLSLLVAVPAAYMCARFSLVLPATALDRSASYIQSWRDSYQSGLGLTLALMIPSALSAIFSDSIAFFFPTFARSLSMIANTLATLFAVAVLSMAFKQLEGLKVTPAS